MLRSEESFVQARGREAAPRRWLPFCAAPASTALLAASTMSHSIFAYPNLRSTRAMSPPRGGLATSASTSHVSCQYGSLSSTALASGLYGGATNDRCGRSQAMSRRTTLTGEPTAMQLFGTALVTRLQNPMTEPSPMRAPARTTACLPNQTWLPMRMSPTGFTRFPVTTSNIGGRRPQAVRSHSRASHRRRRGPLRPQPH